MNFDPFLDFESVSVEMATDLYEALLKNREAQQGLYDVDPRDQRALVTAATRLLETQRTYHSLVENIYQAIFTTPVMVHVAGPKKQEANPDHPEQEGILQRCKRCGSILYFWAEGMQYLSSEGLLDLEEERIPWWREGDIVAKANQMGGVDMYQVEEDRELEKHEMMCVSLTDLEA